MDLGAESGEIRIPLLRQDPILNGLRCGGGELVAGVGHRHEGSWGGELARENLNGSTAGDVANNPKHLGCEHS